MISHVVKVGGTFAGKETNMKFEGKLRSDGKFWLIEVPAFDVMTQGRTKKEAYAMISDALESLIHKKGFSVTVEPGAGRKFYVSSKRIKPLVAFFLKRQRLKHRLTLFQVARQLGLKSHNSYAQYEQARSEPSLSQIQKFISAISPATDIVMTVG